MDSTLISSVEKMASKYGLNLLGAVEKPMTIEQLDNMLKLHRDANKDLTPKLILPIDFTLEEILYAIKEKQFEPFLQPKVGLKTGQLVGAEALARWIHPKHGVIAPYSFIPQLEQSGNMENLTFLMLEKAAKVCRQFRDNGKTMTLSVNLSLSSLSDITLADRITQTVRDVGVDPHHIILEVTESAAMTNVAEALENLARLRMRGFGLSIDDYGTGFSSIQQLTRVPFTELKIDQTFVTHCNGDRALRVILESSIDMARKLRVRSVAEGVEERTEWELLKELNCDVAQGYFIAKPMNCEDFLDFTERYDPR
jgi:EAL domain-containing protein (putative c-di-GMP-specific phosphodiesterase class I)